MVKNMHVIHQIRNPSTPSVDEHIDAGIGRGSVFPKPLVWTPIKMKAGDAVFWSEDLPHYSFRNSSDKVRLCFYYSTFPIDDEWRDPGNPTREWVRHQVRELRFSYGIQANKLPSTSHNPEEMAYFDDHPDDKKRAKTIIRNSALARRMCGLKDYD